MMRLPNQPEPVHTAVLLFGNTVRAGILHVLSKGPATRAELSATLEVGEQSLARQIAMLEDNGIVDSKILPGQGRPTQHSLNPDRLKRFEDLYANYIHGGSGKL
jgi:predicted transcriptional regulator